MANGSDVRESDFDFGDEDEAVRALQTRGVTGAEKFLEYATPAAILASCKHWDKNPKTGVGLLVSMVRDGGVQSPVEPQSPGQRLRAAFADYAGRHPVGSVAMPHLTLQRLRGDLEPVGESRDYPGEDPCDGGMVVIAATYPTMILECEKCGLELAVPAGQLKALPS